MIPACLPTQLLIVRLLKFSTGLCWLLIAIPVPIRSNASEANASVGDANASDADVAFFESRIRPVLIKHCYECHSDDAEIVQAGLQLDYSDTTRHGGDSGESIVPGDPKASLLISALRYEESEMPPAGKLDERIIRDFETWIEKGAIDPRDRQNAASGQPMQPADGFDWEREREFWAFQKPVATPTSIDDLVERKLVEVNLRRNPPADRRTLIRRLSFDLRGLPPTPSEVASYVHDRHPAATDRLIDRFLSDPAFGEHWARRWLDVARYAEDQAHKVGNNDSLTYPNAYRYRDWVIDAIASDMPYDEFIRLQLAADHVRPDDQDAHLALGFLGLGPKYYARNSPEVMADEWEDRVDTVSRGLLGLTVACARCHDHKYDPIPTSDYYALAGVFASTQMFNRPIDETVKTKKGQSEKPHDGVHIVRDGNPRDLHVMVRGDVKRKGDLAKRQFLTILSPNQPIPLNRGSGRADLAEAIVDPTNPLTARVMANRIWRQLMRQGIIETPSNFGKLGEPPSHRALLDNLAIRLIEQNWSIKRFIREIVRTETYRQSSLPNETAMRVDADNRLYWRMSPKRLSIEAYRDSVLKVAGNLDETVGGPSIQPDAPDENRKTLYSEISRMDLNSMLARFGFPDPNAHSAKRSDVTTPLQKLFLLNSPLMQKQAKSLAASLVATDGSISDQVALLYQKLFGRDPTPEEFELAEQFVSTGGSADEHMATWTQYAHMLLISNEMQFID